MTNLFGGLIRLIGAWGTAGTYMTLDCRDANHTACETCSCSCHSGSVEPGTDGHARVHI